MGHYPLFLEPSDRTIARAVLNGPPRTGQMYSSYVDWQRTWTLLAVTWVIAAAAICVTFIAPPRQPQSLNIRESSGSTSAAQNPDQSTKIPETRITPGPSPSQGSRPPQTEIPGWIVVLIILAAIAFGIFLTGGR